MNPETALRLTKELIRINTVNPPGNESDAVKLLAPLLQDAGFTISVQDYGSNRSSLIAHVGPTDRPSVMLSGHLDTVPLGSQPWSKPPFEAFHDDGRLYGRGAADMKSGVAVLVAAAVKYASMVRETPLTLVLSADEEVGCAGVQKLITDKVLPDARCILVAEPTDNVPLLGHKGVLWLKTVFHGKTAHAAFPDLGDNALLSAAHAVIAIEQKLNCGAPHPVMGNPSFVPSRFFSGDNYNSVPDQAELGMDIRSTVNLCHQDILTDIRKILQPYSCELAVVFDLPPLWTPPEDPIVQQVIACCEKINNVPHPPAIVEFYTDGGLLRPALGNVPVVILGPGEPGMAHKVDEYVSTSSLERSFEIYLELLPLICC